jgi:hypothetical protein
MPIVLILLFGSGFSALVYQTAWQRMFRGVFGASTWASAAVLAVFLGGLGLGSALFGRRAEDSKRPLRLYGQLELGIGIAAGLSPLLLELLSRVYFALGGSVALGRWGASGVRLILAGVVMGPAATLMGGTLPSASRVIETADDVPRRRVGLAYSVNGAGAVLGALLATFILFEALGNRTTVYLACAINLLVGAAAFRIGGTAS